MKPRFNLSEIMHNAHRLFKGQSERGSGVRGDKKSFAECLHQAWIAAKKHIGESIALLWMWGAPCVKVQPTAGYDAAVAADYAAGTNGRKYFGD
jgi:hypothetical protein